MIIRAALLAMAGAALIIALATVTLAAECPTVAEWMFQAGYQIGKAGRSPKAFRRIEGSTAQAVLNHMADHSKEGTKLTVDALLLVFGDERTSIGIVHDGKVCINMRAQPELVTNALRDIEGVRL